MFVLYRLCVFLLICSPNTGGKADNLRVKCISFNFHGQLNSSIITEYPICPNFLVEVSQIQKSSLYYETLHTQVPWPLAVIMKTFAPHNFSYVFVQQMHDAKHRKDNVTINFVYLQDIFIFYSFNLARKTELTGSSCYFSLTRRTK